MLSSELCRGAVATPLKMGLLGEQLRIILALVLVRNFSLAGSGTELQPERGDLNHPMLEPPTVVQAAESRGNDFIELRLPRHWQLCKVAICKLPALSRGFEVFPVELRITHNST